MMLQAVLSNRDHPEYGVATIPFPIPRDQYAHCMELLEALEIGDAVKADCKVEKIDSFYSVLKRTEMLTVNVEELNYLAKRLDSFDTGEAAQFQAMAHKLELFELKDLINLTFCCQQATIITDFSDLAAIGRDHYMNLHGGCASVDELNKLNGEETARRLIENGGGTITPCGVVYDNGRCKIYNLDFPDVIALRQQLLPAGEREQNIPCDLKDPAWFDKIDASGGAVFFASGVFYYFLTQQVRELVQGMADAFPGGVLVFDAANRTAVKMIAKTWLKTAKIKDVGAYFAVSDAKSELSPWDNRLQVSSRGYMLGYNDLKDPSVNSFFRFLAKVGDGMMKMQIVKIRFSGREQEKKEPVAMKNHKAK